jgi:hypothetical protein
MAARSQKPFYLGLHVRIIMPGNECKIDIYERSRKMRIARNEQTPAGTLRRLAVDEDIDVRSAVAENERIPLDIRETLSKDSAYKVRALLATNTSNPPSIIDVLSKDKDYNVRSVVAANRFTPPHILDNMSKDTDSHVRWLVAGNRNASRDVILDLLNDKDDHVRGEASWRIRNWPRTDVPREVDGELNDTIKEMDLLQSLNVAVDTLGEQGGAKVGLYDTINAVHELSAKVGRMEEKSESLVKSGQKLDSVDLANQALVIHKDKELEEAAVKRVRKMCPAQESKGAGK